MKFYWKTLLLRRGINLPIHPTFRCNQHCPYCFMDMPAEARPLHETMKAQIIADGKIIEALRLELAEATNEKPYQDYIVGIEKESAARLAMANSLRAELADARKKIERHRFALGVIHGGYEDNKTMMTRRDGKMYYTGAINACKEIEEALFVAPEPTPKQPAPVKLGEQVSNPEKFEPADGGECFTKEELLIRSAICGTSDCENDPMCPEWYESGCIAEDICKHLAITLPKEVDEPTCECGTNPFPPDNHAIMFNRIDQTMSCLKCGKKITVKGEKP